MTIRDLFYGHSSTAAALLTFIAARFLLKPAPTEAYQRLSREREAKALGDLAFVLATEPIIHKVTPAQHTALAIRNHRNPDVLEVALDIGLRSIMGDMGEPSGITLAEMVAAAELQLNDAAEDALR
jgi:hypothetical protein